MTQDGPRPMRRIAIIGCAGAGKSTLAAALSQQMDLPLVHLDAEHWQPGWVEPPLVWWQQRVSELVAGEQWIIDGNYGRTMPVVLGAADTIIFLDLPRLVCLSGVMQRAFGHWGETRPDMAAGCPEQLDAMFLKWIWNYPKRDRPRILDRIREHGEGRAIYILRSRRQIRTFSEGIEQRRLREVCPASSAAVQG